MENPRKDFYSKEEFDLDRVNWAIDTLATNLNLAEILKVIREISYDMVTYYDENTCARIYKDDSYSKTTREQACRIQRLLSTACDLFKQSVIDGREFDEGYLQKWTDGGYLQSKVFELEDKIKSYEEGELNYEEN